MYRQGDLLIIKIDKLPEELIKLPSLNILGSSVTGHIHKITNKKNKVFSNEPTSKAKGNFYLEINEEDTLVHEEHKSIVLPKGFYEVIRQREVTGYVRD